MTFSGIVGPQAFDVPGVSEYTVASNMARNHIFYIEISHYTVRTIRPEKCDIFSQRYQSQPITTKFQKHCLCFLNLQKPCQNISLSEYFA